MSGKIIYFPKPHRARPQNKHSVIHHNNQLLQVNHSRRPQVRAYADRTSRYLYYSLIALLLLAAVPAFYYFVIWQN